LPVVRPDLSEVGVREDARFKLDGQNIIVVVPITPWEAALGATVKVPTLAGEVELRIPPGSNTGSKLRLRGRGWPGKVAGDQIVVLEIHTPRAETDAQKQFYETMASSFDFKPRG
jgi:curved DNA-binding protein